MGNTSLDIVSTIRQREKELVRGKEQLLGKGLFIPNNPANSGSRKILQSTQIEQLFPVLNAETPILQTGYENEMGRFSSTYKVAETDMQIIAKINKYNFGNLDDHHYYVIVRKPNNEYDVIERISYQYVTETFGSVYNNAYLDNITKVPNGVIKKGDVYQKSISYDDEDNRCDGVNLITGYLAMEHSKEDSILISESAAKKMVSPLIISVDIQVNDNDIPVNLYGDDNVYKIIPDIGEEINDDILCALRREDSEHILYSQAYDRLQTLLASDEKYFAKGTVIDIDVFTNNEELLNNRYYHQLKYYHDERVRTHREIFEVVEGIKHRDPNATLSYELSRIYSTAKNIIRGADYINKDGRKFSNIVLHITVLEYSTLKPGDKITNRYGGKGCISKILPDEMMPMLDSGDRIELVYTPPSVINRSNIGLLLEQSTNFISARLIEDIGAMRGKIPEDQWYDDAAETFITFISYISPTMGDYMGSMFSLLPHEKRKYVDDVMNDRCLLISPDPAGETLSINTLMDIYKSFPVEPYTMTVPVKRSDGTYALVKSRRKIVCSKQYIWRLKQYSSDQISAVSLSSTNIRGENSKSNSKKLNKTLYSRTCIRFGNMETGNMLHLSPEVTVANLMINSLSPKARRNYMELLEGDVFDVDIKLDDGCINRAVEIVNAKLKAIGLRLEFSKVAKRKNRLFLKNISIFTKDEIDNFKQPIFINDLRDGIPIFQPEDQRRPLRIFKSLKPTLFVHYTPTRTLFTEED